MSRAVLITASLLIVSGAGVFAWKAYGLGLPLRPQEHEGVWQVHLEITVRGEGAEASIRAPLPSDRPSQRVFGEHFSSDRLRLDIRKTDGVRMAVWRGWMEGVHRIHCDFSVQIFPTESAMPAPPYREPGPTLRQRYTQPTVGVPSSAAEIRALLDELELPDPSDVAGRIRRIYAFVRHEVSGGESSGDDALLTLAQRAGSRVGRERLLAALLRGSGVPTRLVRGLRLAETRPEPMVWNEAWVDGRWVPLSASHGFFGESPRDTLVFSEEDLPFVQASGVRAFGWKHAAIREHLSADELATLMLPPSPVLRSLSLYRLSTPMQSALRILLLMTAAVLVVSLLRNVLGMPSFGTFMPMLLALAMRGTGLLYGLLLVSLVMATGIVGRLALERLRLLLVPRLSILLCVVVLCVAALGLFGRGVENANFYAGVVLPIVILTMLIERVSIVMVEEGTREALVRGAFSVTMAIIVYPIFRSATLEHLMFGFPELVLVIMGILVLVGGYTGYRLTDLLRFRALEPRGIR